MTTLVMAEEEFVLRGQSMQLNRLSRRQSEDLSVTRAAKPKKFMYDDTQSEKSEEGILPLKVTIQRKTPALARQPSIEPPVVVPSKQEKKKCPREPLIKPRLIKSASSSRTPLRMSVMHLPSVSRSHFIDLDEAVSLLKDLVHFDKHAGRRSSSVASHLSDSFQELFNKHAENLQTVIDHEEILDDLETFGNVKCRDRAFFTEESEEEESENEKEEEEEEDNADEEET